MSAITVSELIVDAYGCRCDLSDPLTLERAVRDAAGMYDGSSGQSYYYRKRENGLTACLMLRDLHVVVNSWSSEKIAIVHLFTRSTQTNLTLCWDLIARALNPTHAVRRQVKHDRAMASSGSPGEASI